MRDSIDDLAPELLRDGLLEILGRKATVLRARGDGPARAGFGIPKPLYVLFSERHGRVETDNRRQARYVQDGLNHRFARFGVQVVDLRGVVPRHRGAVVAVIDITFVAGVTVLALKDDSRVRRVVVMVFQKDTHPVVLRQVGAIKAIARVGRTIQTQKPVRMLDDPATVDTDMVGYHVRGHADTALPRSSFKRFKRLKTAQVFGDHVVVERIRRRHRVGITAQVLDGFTRFGAFPEPDQPEPGKAAPREFVQLFVGDFI